MISADVRARLTHALRLDLIGPEADEPQAGEVLAIPPSRFYLTGFLAPLNAPASQKADEDEQGELELAAASGGAKDDDSTPDPPAAKLRLIFDAISETRAVYLFDEFDALGTDRASRNEVGEIRRVLNSFLQFIEHEDSDSIIVAATNHPGLLDRALMRRFDAVIQYALPSKTVALDVLKNRLALLKTPKVRWATVQKATEGLSHAELARACENAVKNAILGRRTSLETAEVVEALKERRSSHP